MNSKSKGEITEGLILGKLLNLGYSVSIPFGNNQRYDLILDNGNKLLKIQCKTARLFNGCVRFSTSSKNGFTGVRKDYREQIDLFAVYCPEINKFYLIPVSDIPISEANLRIDNPNRTTKGCDIIWASKYEI